MREISSCIHTKNARWCTWDTAVNKIQTAILIQWGRETQEQSDECHSKGDRGQLIQAWRVRRRFLEKHLRWAPKDEEESWPRNDDDGDDNSLPIALTFIVPTQKQGLLQVLYTRDVMCSPHNSLLMRSSFILSCTWGTEAWLRPRGRLT